MGGKASKGTSADKRLAENMPSNMPPASMGKPSTKATGKKGKTSK